MGVSYGGNQTLDKPLLDSPRGQIANEFVYPQLSEAHLSPNFISMTFQYVQPTVEQTDKMNLFRDRFESLYNEIIGSIQEKPHSISYDKCFEKLQEASFWLNKAITKND